MLVRQKVSEMLSLIMLILFSLAASQANTENSASDQHGKRRTSDPVANFFSELGDFFLDVDQTIAVQTQPKVEHEANVMSRLFRPRTDYFDRIQKNYRDVQKRLGSLIGNSIGFKDSYSDHELSTVSPPAESIVSTIPPDYNPFAAAEEERKEKLKQRNSKGNLNKKDSTEFKGSIPKSIEESFRAFGKLSKAIMDDIGDISKKEPSKTVDKAHKKRMGNMVFQEECSNEVLEDPDLEQRRQEKCSRIAAEERARESLRKLMEPKRVAETLDELSKSILARSGDILLEKDLADVEKDSEKSSVENLNDECLSEILEDVALESVRREKCDRIAAEKRLMNDLNKLLKDSKLATEKLIPVSSKITDDLSQVLIRRSGDAENENLSNIFSGLSFDEQIRQLIKDHGSWILDYPLIKRWRQRDRSVDNGVSTEASSEETRHTTVESTSEDIVEIEPTEIYVPVSTDYRIALKSGEVVPENPHQSSYYRIVDDNGDIVEEEVDFVLQPELLSNEIKALEVERQEPKETLILAFTPDGLPLKLRLGPEVHNPMKYLHKALKSAGVSLNIPVESYDDLEPVGKEVLKLGSGILTRSVLINASDSDELKSLLEVLMESKAAKESN